jgi:hypothetical protein
MLWKNLAKTQHILPSDLIFVFRVVKVSLEITSVILLVAIDRMFPLDATGAFTAQEAAKKGACKK